MILAVTRLIPSSPTQPRPAWGGPPTPRPARWAAQALSPLRPRGAKYITSRMDGPQRRMGRWVGADR